jgi:hypothetical protein
MSGRKKTSSSQSAGVPPVPGNARPGYPPPPRAARPVQGSGPPGASWHLPSGTTARPTAGPRGLVLAYDSLGSHAVVGQVSNFKTRTEFSMWRNGNTSVWNFNVVRYDRRGNQKHPMMPVEIRGGRLTGILNDGEWVSVPGKWQRGRVRRVKRVHNLTTDTPVGKTGLFF